ncbi:MAG: AAA family ATPase, partial [Myxococcota bacterium]
YLEDSTDLDLLKGFAKVLNHSVLQYLESPFIRYVGNKPEDARNHYYGLKEAIQVLRAVALLTSMK